MLLAIAYSCHAAVIPIFGIEAFHQGDSLDANGSVLRAIDASGMSIPDSNDPSTWTVSSNAWADDWQGFASPTAGANNTWAVVDLGAPAANIETMYLWNVQEGITAPGNGQWARGCNEFEVFYATAPTISPAVAGPVQGRPCYLAEVALAIRVNLTTSRTLRVRATSGSSC